MRHAFAVSLAVALACAASGADEKKLPGRLVFPSKAGDAIFDHPAHLKREQGACTSCHDKLWPKSTATPLKSSAGCRTCHRAAGSAFEEKGACRRCHPSMAAPPQAAAAPAKPAAQAWRYAAPLPVIDNLRRPEGLTPRLAQAPLQNWNDPSVMKDGSTYVMWASLGLQGGGKGVSIYRLTSPDGLAWNLANGGNPVLEPGAPGEFDWYGVETPAVIQANGKYHLYYTAYRDPDPVKGGNFFTMGHATSDDGDRWTKLGELTSLTKVVGRKEGNPWGWLARAEPAPLFADGTFYLYFADVRCRRDDCTGVPAARRGISLAASQDGHDFRQVGSEPVLLQSSSYPESEGWEGYSTPWAMRDGADFVLFADLFRHNARGRFQTRIAHYRSRDGIRFEEVRRDVVAVEGHPWAAMSVRAPAVIVDGGEYKMWFAGDNFDPANKPKDMLGAIRSGELRMGIGMATGPRQ